MLATALPLAALIAITAHIANTALPSLKRGDEQDQAEECSAKERG